MSTVHQALALALEARGYRFHRQLPGAIQYRARPSAAVLGPGFVFLTESGKVLLGALLAEAQPASSALRTALLEEGRALLPVDSSPTTITLRSPTE